MKQQTITRDNLKKIHDIACSGWKTKLEDYAKRNVFGNEIVLEQSEIDEMFNVSDNAQKKVLNQFFTKPLSIIDRVKSFKDACDVLGISESSIHKRDRILIIIKALNEGWVPDWTNHNECKYWNYFQHSTKGVFSFFGCNYNTYSASVPSALYLKNRDLAAHAIKIGLKEYQDHYVFQY